MSFFFNSTYHIMKSGFLKEGQTICDTRSTSPSLSDPPLAFLHSIPRILPLTPLPSRRETGGHPLSLKPQVCPIDQKELCSILLRGMQISFHCQDWVPSELGKMTYVCVFIL